MTLSPEQSDAYEKVWSRHFAQVRAVFELLDNNDRDPSMKPRLKNARLLIEDSVSRAHQSIDEIVR